MKVYATTPDTGAVRRYYEDMADGKLTQYSTRTTGRGRVRHRVRYSAQGGRKGPTVQLVTPVAMATNQARARLQHPSNRSRSRASSRPSINTKRRGKRRSTGTKRKPVSKGRGRVTGKGRGRVAGKGRGRVAGKGRGKTAGKVRGRVAGGGRRKASSKGRGKSAQSRSRRGRDNFST